MYQSTSFSYWGAESLGKSAFEPWVRKEFLAEIFHFGFQEKQEKKYSGFQKFRFLSSVIIIFIYWKNDDKMLLVV